MKAKLIDKTELKKTPDERQAEGLLRRLEPDKAIEVTPDGSSTRTIRRLFSKCAGTLGLEIELKSKDDKVYVLLKKPRDSGDGQ